MTSSSSFARLCSACPSLILEAVLVVEVPPALVQARLALGLPVVILPPREVLRVRAVEPGLELAQEVGLRVEAVLLVPSCQQTANSCQAGRRRSVAPMRSKPNSPTRRPWWARIFRWKS